VHGVRPMLGLSPFPVHCDESVSRVYVIPKLVGLRKVLVGVLSPPVQAFPLSRDFLYTS
jgi:hypothetical protein